MDENTKSNITFNIHGGNIQILPNATHAEQNFYGDTLAEKMQPRQGAAATPLTADEQALTPYINNVEALRGYLSTLRSCTTAQAVGEVVATMCQQEAAVAEDLIVKEGFIRLLLPFLPQLDKGRSIDNLRAAINKAWAARRKMLPKSKSI